MSIKIRPIAIYLPQFHPISENNAWWGKGFTEWTNVAKSKSLFKGHQQPRIPADLGFTDLRLAETREAQAELAKSYGIEGFCYYHYWFHGKQLIERPFNEVLNSGHPNFPFCLFWANETWSRRWLGEEKEILIKQEYSESDDINHARYLVKVFRDERNIRVGNRPIFVIYRPLDLPSPRKTIDLIKTIAYSENKEEPFIIASNSHCGDNELLLSLGFDQVLNFRPQLGVLPMAFDDGFNVERFFKNIIKIKKFDGKIKVYDYQLALKLMEKIEPTNFEKIIPSVFVGWDNSPRRGNKGIIMQNNTPELFKAEIVRVAKKIQNSNQNTGFLFINAWNEWAEGNYLEPDTVKGLEYLKSIKILESLNLLND